MPANSATRRLLLSIIRHKWSNCDGRILLRPALDKRPATVFKAGGKVQLIEEGGRLVITLATDGPIEAATEFLAGKFSLTDDLRRNRPPFKNVSECFAAAGMRSDETPSPSISVISLH